MQTKCVVTLRLLVALLLVIFGAPAMSAQTAIATVALTPGWATFGQAGPPRGGPTALAGGSPPTKTEVKGGWRDASIRFALVPANVPSTGNFAITAGTPAPGTFAPILPTASVTLTIGGVAYLATLPRSVAADSWMSGPLAY